MSRARHILEQAIPSLTKEQKKAKILSAIKERGWHTAEIYHNEAKELEREGKVKRGTRYVTGGTQKPVWVATGVR